MSFEYIVFPIFFQTHWKRQNYHYHIYTTNSVDRVGLCVLLVCWLFFFFLQKNDGLPVATRVHSSSQWVFLMFVGVACVGGLLVGSLTIACLRSHAQQLASRKLGLGPEAGSATHYAYQVSGNLFCITLNYIWRQKTYCFFSLIVSVRVLRKYERGWICQVSVSSYFCLSHF